MFIVLAIRLYCHKMKIYNPGFKHILKQKNFLRRFDLNDIDLKNVYTITIIFASFVFGMITLLSLGKEG